MAGPDNQRFESMLRRELRDEASRVRVDCPRPEQLAALWDRSLSRPERALVQSHIAGCARCQSTMAAMARADWGEADRRAGAHAPGLWVRIAAPAAVLAVIVFIITIHLFGAPMRGGREQIAMAMRRPLHRHPAKSEAVLTPAPPPSEMNLAQLAKSGPQPAAPPRAAVESAQSKLQEKPPETSLAAKAKAPPPQELAMAERQKPAAAANEGEAALKRSDAAPSPAAASAAAPSMLGQPARPAQQMGAAESSSMGQSAPAQASAPDRPEASLAPVERPAYPAHETTVPEAGNTAPPQAQAGAASDYAAKAVEGAGTAAGAPTNAPASVGGQPGAAGAAVGGSTLSMQTATTASPPSGLRAGLASFQSPPPVVAWNVGSDGLIQRLGQNGWETLHSGTSVDLIAGSAPSPQVCWVAGKNGTLLRTIDGGDHWQPIEPPASVDLMKVEAGGADSATVTTADGHRFATIDGGRNWTSE